MQVSPQTAAVILSYAVQSIVCLYETFKDTRNNIHAAQLTSHKLAFDAFQEPTGQNLLK